MVITNGTVERVYKPGDYESRRVSLSFNIDPGEDINSVLAQVTGLAEAHARQQPSPVAAVPPTQVVIPPPAKRGPGRPPASPATSLNTAVVSNTGPIATSGVSPSDPFAPAPLDFRNAVPIDPVPVEPDTSTVVPPGPSTSPASVDPRLTDQALSEACALRVNGAPDRTVFAQSLVKLRAEYTGSPALTVAAIPMEKRVEFLERLGGL